MLFNNYLRSRANHATKFAYFNPESEKFNNDQFTLFSINFQNICLKLFISVINKKILPHLIHYSIKLIFIQK